MNELELIKNDPWLEPYREAIQRRRDKALRQGKRSGRGWYPPVLCQWSSLLWLAQDRKRLGYA